MPATAAQLQSVYTYMPNVREEEGFQNGLIIMRRMRCAQSETHIEQPALTSGTALA
jgi:hypothetical protein